MIVCADGFRDLGVLAQLIPGCELPPIDPDPQTTNVQFFTEYSLVESIFGARTKARFPDPPTTKDTPDVMILVKGSKSTLVAIEAKMYHQPQLHSLVKQLQAQRAQLTYLQHHVRIDTIHHAALLPAGYAETIGESVSVGEEKIPVITWEGLLAAYREVRGGDDYFMAVLDIALRRWEELCSQPLAYGANAEAKVKGEEIVRRFGIDPSLSVMGRTGGIEGPVLSADLVTGDWKTYAYEVSSAPEPPNSNWFYVSEFVQRVEKAAAVSPGANPTAAVSPGRPGKRTMTGGEIMESLGDPRVRIVGRNGGATGKAFHDDVLTGGWRTWPYQVSSDPVPPNPNWFTVEKFRRLVGWTDQHETGG